MVHSAIAVQTGSQNVSEFDNTAQKDMHASYWFSAIAPKKETNKKYWKAVCLSGAMCEILGTNTGYNYVLSLEQLWIHNFFAMG